MEFRLFLQSASDQRTTTTKWFEGEKMISPTDSWGMGLFSPSQCFHGPLYRLLHLSEYLFSAGTQSKAPYFSNNGQEATQPSPAGFSTTPKR